MVFFASQVGGTLPAEVRVEAVALKLEQYRRHKVLGLRFEVEMRPTAFPGVRID